MTIPPHPQGSITTDLTHYLQRTREHIVSTLDGLDEYAVRRPMTPTGTNLLGLVKHLASGELRYLGDCVGGPAPVALPWMDDGSVWDGADMWAKPGESREWVIDLYRTAWAHSDASIAELGLDAPAQVPWWPAERRRTTLGHLLVRVVDETAHHAGHADIVRELLDGRGGADRDEMGDRDYWQGYVAQIQAAADTFDGRR